MNLPCGCIMENGEFTHVCESCASELARKKVLDDAAATLTLEDRVAALERTVFHR